MGLTSHALRLAETAGHQTGAQARDVAELASDVAVELELDDDDRQEIELAALLHDIGKRALINEIVDRPDQLSEQEVLLVRKHPLWAQTMLERAGEPFQPIARIARSCQEHWDGTGYPDGLARDEIPLAARIIFCCAAYTSMTSGQPYRKPMSHAGAIREIWECSGSQFDPGVVPALVRAASERTADAVAETVPDARTNAVDLAKAGASGARGDLG